MLRCLIVDDEMLVRVGVRATVNWEKMGFEIVGEAGDGEEALILARKTRPDVILTDITMPGMDGLQLIGHIRKEFPKTKILVLSCHRDFDIVREAMKDSAVLDYLLKIKMTPEELTRVMNRVRETILREREADGEVLQMQWKLNANAYDIRRKAVLAWLNQLHDAPETAVRWPEQAPDFHGKTLVAVRMLMDHHASVLRGRNDSGDAELTVFSVLNIGDELIGSSGGTGTIVYERDGRFLMLLGYSEAAAARTADFCRQLMKHLEMYLNLSVSFGISHPVQEAQQLPETIVQAEAAAGRRFFEGWKSICYPPLRGQVRETEGLTTRDEQRLEQLVSGPGDGALEACLLELAGQLSVKDGMTREDILNYFTDILHVFSRLIRLKGGNLRMLKDGQGRDPWQSLEDCECMEELHQWISLWAPQWGAALGETQDTSFSREVRQVVDYIRHHWQEEIRLPELAQAIHLSESYLSVLFKKETGSSLTDYIARYRTDKVKAMLKDHNRRLSEIWQEAGYSSFSYFTRAFKKATGMTPMAYKRSVTEQIH